MVYLPDHSHCQYCGNPTPFGTDFCDDDCKALHVAEEAAEKRKDRIFYAKIAVSLIALAIAAIAIKFIRG